MISTRGRYALRVLIDLAEHKDEGYIPMKEIAKRQGISLKYIERIMPMLVKDNMVDGISGKGGGYKLNRPAEEYSVGHILRLTEGDLAPVACLGCNAEQCERRGECKTISMWEKYHSMTTEYFDSISIADLLNKQL